MPVSPTYPGVYINELPSAVRTITGVPTSIAAFVGAAPRGRIDRPVRITSFADYQREFGGLDAKYEMSYAVYQFYANGGSEAYVVRIAGAPVKEEGEDSLPEATATLFLPAPPPSGEDPPPAPKLAATSPGRWGRDLRAHVTHVERTVAGVTATFYTLRIGTERDGVLETYENISINPTLGLTLEQSLAASTLVRFVTGNEVLPAANTPVAVGERYFVTPTGAAGASDQPFVKARGGSAGDPTPADFKGGDTGEADKAGIYQLSKIDIFNMLILCGDGLESLVAQVAAFAASRRAMLIVPSPASWTSLSAARDGALPLTGDLAKNAAVYFPDVFLDADAGARAHSPAGTIAGLWARTDAQRGVWKAPAGTDASLNGVRELTVPLTDLENGQLNPLGINCLRSFPVIGPVSWGARTLRGADRLADQWKYVPVRRTALFIEESLYRGTQWVVFEPNDEPLWSSIRLNVGAFMNNLFRQGAFQGRTPREAYVVKCDAENNPQNDIDRGIVNILVGFSPLKPAEFVIINIQQLAGQIQV